MLFMPSYKVEKTEPNLGSGTTKVTLAEDPGSNDLNEGCSVWAVQNNIYDLFSIESRDGRTLVLKPSGEVSLTEGSYVAIISIGSIDGNQETGHG
jgi:hypothetical protein